MCPQSVALGVSPVNRPHGFQVVNSRARGRRVADAGSILQSQPISNLLNSKPEMKKAHPKMGFLVLSLWASSKGMRLLAWKTYRRKLWINVRKEV